MVNKKIFRVILLVAILMLSFTTLSFATGGKELNPVGTENNNNLWKNGETTVSGIDVGLPKDASMETAGDWVDRKGNDVIMFLQRGSQSFLIIIFIVGALMAAAGGRRGRPAGFTMIGLAVVAQAFIMFAPEIMDFLQTWIAQ